MSEGDNQMKRRPEPGIRANQRSALLDPRLSLRWNPLRKTAKAAQAEINGQKPVRTITTLIEITRSDSSPLVMVNAGITDRNAHTQRTGKATDHAIIRRISGLREEVGADFDEVHSGGKVTFLRGLRVYS